MTATPPDQAPLDQATFDQAALDRAPASLLRFITCGSVDDGKSTLIGRLLHDARAVPADELDALARASARGGMGNGALDFSLLVDGLSAEREQGITIDVAYRYFATPARSFIVADTPGHEQYTRNMVTGASTADLAVILVDVRQGVTTQTRRHSRIVRLLGIRHVVLAVNKMDLVDHDRAAFDAVVADYAGFASTAGIDEVVAIPVSGLTGANIVDRGAAMPWYDGPTLLTHLETVRIDPPARRGFRMPVQWINRATPDFRGQAGTIVAGGIAVGDPLRIVPAGRITRLARILGPDGERVRAVAGEAVTLVLADAVDCARGDVIAGVDDPPEVADAFNATLIWMDAAPLVPGRACLLKLATQTVVATVKVRHRIDIASGAPRPAETLALNDIGHAEVAAATPLVFERFADGPALGGFILIDRETDATVAGGLIEEPVRRASNIHWQQLDVTREARARQKGQHPRILWFTGLSGSGKSTLANLVERALHAEGRHSFLLDGDNVRHGLNRDLGFSAGDRAENVRRVGEVARLMADAGLIVLVAFISPFAAERDRVRALMPAGEFVEIFVDAPLDVAEARDPKGLYAKARAGLIPDFTGISSPYEPPVAPDIHIDAANEAPEEAARRIVAHVLALEARSPA